MCIVFRQERGKGLIALSATKVVKGPCQMPKGFLKTLSLPSM
jgi:hypothetical protein